jgi:predicted amidohydrolase
MTRAIAVQAKWDTSRYETYERFQAMTRSLMSLASEHMASEDVNLVVFPEDFGTPLILAAGGMKLRDERSFESAVRSAVAQNLPGLLWMRATRGVSFVRGLFLKYAREMAWEFLGIMTQMARTYGTYLVPGSILLPLMKSETDLSPVGNAVYNTSFLISPEGRVIGSQRKVHLIDLEMEEGLDTTPGELDWIKTYETRAGRLGIAVCLDAFKDDVVERLVSQGAQILVQPSANPERWQEALEHGWEKGSWGMVQRHDALHYGINPMMVGEMFGMVFEGVTSITAKASRTPDGSGYLARARTLDEQEIVHADLQGVGSSP